MQTPYELGNQNQTTTWEACIQFYQALAQRCPDVLQFSQIGVSDAGIPDPRRHRECRRRV
jgi:hypothetical protein